MLKIKVFKFFIFCLFIVICSKSFAQESTFLEVDTTSGDILAKDKIEGEYASSQDNGQSRGLVAFTSGYLISKGVETIKQMIDNRKKEFTSQYDFAKGDLDFYDRVSVLSAFDPIGLRFKGFTIVRLHKSDTVFMAKFVLDTSENGIKEIMDNGIFKLKLDRLIITQAKVKKPKHPKKLNMDIEIDFLSSYRSMDGQIFTDVPLGKFVYSLRDAPIKKDSSSKSYYEKKKNDTLSGQCFIVPRSVGYFKNKATGKIEQCWGRGMYSIKVTVTETSKNRFVDKIIMDASDPVLGIVPTYLQSKVPIKK
ncbi:MAG TPA: hypothetical protein VK718_03375 [Ferruginibacter sp.]|jgi:hypothetical protein|nr:hypothetical protein [Ferruginibacter sp.]